MYGWINDTMEKFVISQFGLEAWEIIKAKADVSQPDGRWFLATSYSDDSTYDLVNAAAGVLGVSTAVVYHKYGVFFIDYMCDRGGYHDMLCCLGGCLREWMARVNLLHSHLKISCPEMQSPDIWCLNDKVQSENSFMLHYRTSRETVLSALVVGCVERAAEKFFNSRITMEQLSQQDEDGATSTSWRVAFAGKIDPALPAPPINAMDSSVHVPSELDTLKQTCPHFSRTGTCSVDSTTSIPPSAHSQTLHASPPTRSAPPLDTCPRSASREKSRWARSIAAGRPAAGNYGLSASQIQRLFPFHIVFDKNLEILQLGKHVQEFVVSIDIGKILNNFFEIVTAPFSWNWDALMVHAGVGELGIQTLQHCSKSAHAISLLGNLSFSDDKEYAFLLCAPNVKSVSDMVQRGMNMSHLVGQSARLESVLQNENMVNTTDENTALKELTSLLEEERVASLKLMEEVTNTTQEALALKKTFVRYVSHEIRTPLTVVQLGLSLLEQQVAALTKATPTQRDTMDNLHCCREATNIAVSILGDLLSYENLESGRLVLHKKHVRPSQFVAAAIDPFKLQGKMRNVSVSVDIQKRVEDLFISVDPAKMSQVLRNLLSNAIKFSTEGGEVTVSVGWEPSPMMENASSKASSTISDDGGSRNSPTHIRGDLAGSIVHNLKTMREFEEQRSHLFREPTTYSENEHSFAENGRIVIQFVDDGQGISPLHQSVLFDGSTDFNPEVLTSVGGSGLGLWISQGIMKLHGGDISVTSAGEGNGSTFTIRVPSYRLRKSAKLSMEEAVEWEHSSSMVTKSISQLAVDTSLPASDSHELSGVGKNSPSTTYQSPIKDPLSTNKSNDNGRVSFFHEKRCLVVDDVKMVRNVLQRAVASRGGICAQVEDGADAIECVKRTLGTDEEFQVILMDFVMPGVDGPTATSVLRQIGCNCLIIGVTGNVMPDDVKYFMDHGANAVFGKPVSFEDVEDYLRKLTR